MVDIVANLNILYQLFKDTDIPSLCSSVLCIFI